MLARCLAHLTGDKIILPFAEHRWATDVKMSVDSEDMEVITGLMSSYES